MIFAGMNSAFLRFDAATFTNISVGCRQRSLMLPSALMDPEDPSGRDVHWPAWPVFTVSANWAFRLSLLGDR